jgi:anthranilate synthase component I
MIKPDLKEFVKLAKKGNLVPVYKEIVADMETPVSAFKKIAGPCSFLLESVEGGEKIARYSFLGTCPKSEVQSPKSFAQIKELLGQYKPVKIPGLPRFSGGLVGYIGYDAVRQIEKIPDANPDDLNVPLMQFILADTLLAFDHIKHKIIIIANARVAGDPAAAYRRACRQIAALETKLKKPLKTTELKTVPRQPVKFSSNVTRQEYEEMVRHAKSYIKAGDIIQVVLSQRLEAKCHSEPFDVYRALRAINPSPYMYYLNLGDMQIVGSSPEVMVRLENGVATLRPIAGTRPRGRDEAEDKKLAEGLLASKKERAEHVMLVDLGRNDLGRVCDYGSVKVTEEMVIEKYSHVMHIVSNVSGRLKRGRDAVDLVRSEERRVGKECHFTCRSRWSPYH